MRRYFLRKSSDFASWLYPSFIEKTLENLVISLLKLWKYVLTYLSSLKTKLLCLVFFSLHNVLVNRCLKWPGLSITSLIIENEKKCEHDFDLNSLYFLQSQAFIHIAILMGPLINDLWTESTIPIQGGFQLLDLIIMELKSHMTC